MIFVFSLIFVALVSEVFTVRPVIVLSFDGFQSDYINEKNAPYLFNVLLEKAARPSYMTSVFPTKTFVTHFTLSTGVYPQTHGVYGNQMFDVGDNTPEQFQTLVSIVPIWIENQKVGNGRHSGVMMWPGSEFSYGKDVFYKPTYIQKYNKDIEWNKRVDTIVDWMTRTSNRANLVMAYFEYVPCYDKTKRYDHLTAHIKKVDDTIKQIYNGLKLANEEGDFDMIIISDKGTQQIEYDCVMKIEDYISLNYSKTDVKVIVSGPIVFVKPTNALYNKILKELKNHNDNGYGYTVHTIDTFSSHQKMTVFYLSAVIILVAKNGYTFYPKAKLENIVAVVGKENFVTEENGYDIYDKNMKGFFLGIGPSFKRNITTISPFGMIDVYPLLKKLLMLPDSPSYFQKNVSLNNVVKHILSENTKLTPIQVTYQTILRNVPPKVRPRNKYFD